MVKYIRGIIGIILILAVVGGIFLWESVGREYFEYGTIVVLKNHTYDNSTITADMLGIMKVPKDTIIESAVTNPEEIIGKAARHYLPACTQLVPEYFEEEKLTIKNGQYVLSISPDWIVSYPQTLRRGDTLYFYAFKDGREVRFDENGNAVINDTEKNSRIICKAVVAYAKDGGTQEVVSDDLQRLTGSGNVNLIEIITDSKTAAAITGYAESGYSFVLLYN